MLLFVCTTNLLSIDIQVYAYKSLNLQKSLNNTTKMQLNSNKRKIF